VVVVYCYVCGDILHKGHIEHLRNAKALGDRLIVGVLTDQAIMEKKVRPVMNFDQRFDLIRSLSCVDVVVPQHAYSPLTNIMRLKPDVLIESSDHKDQPANNFMEQNGGRVFVMPYYPDYSSTALKAAIREA